MSETPCSRPRIEGEREKEILDAVVAVLLDVGYDKLNFDLVAANAHASKATLYRKWPSKAELVMAAVVNSKACHLADTPLPDTGTLEGDLLALTANKDGAHSRISDVIGAVAPALSRDSALREQFVCHFAQPRIDRYAEIIERARSRGDIDESVDTEILRHVLPSFAIHHTLVLGGPPSTDYMTRVVRQVLLPAAGLAPDQTTPEGGADVHSS